jgi:hypothetical protein
MSKRDSKMLQERARSLSRKIHKAMLRAMEELVVPGIGGSAMSVEMFLSALECVYGRALLRQFDDPGAFLRMRRELIPDRRRGKSHAAVSQPLKDAFCVHKTRHQLRDLLWNATRIARATGKRSADLPEVMAALCLNDDLVAQLKQKHGFRPVRFLEKLLPGPDYLSPD